MLVLIPKKGVNNMDTSDYKHFIENLRAKLESKVRGIVAIETVDGGGMIIYIYSPGDFIHSYHLKNAHEMFQDNDGLDKVTNAVLEEYKKFIIRQYFY